MSKKPHTFVDVANNVHKSVYRKCLKGKSIAGCSDETRKKKEYGFGVGNGE